MTKNTTLTGANILTKISQFLSIASAMLFSCMVYAAAPAGPAKVSTFFATVVTLLSTITVGVVTIAIIFIGYQVAFNNKRLSDMSGVIIGAVIVGAAGQIANLLAGTATAVT